MRRADAVALIGASAAALAYPRRARAQATALRIGSVAADAYAEPYYAQDLGSFARAGLNVELSSFPNGAALAAAVVGGSVDAGVGDATEVANGVARGVPFALFAGCGLYSTKAPTTLLCVAKDGPVASAKDLEGGVVAVISLVSLASTAVKAWLTNNGADLAKVRLVEMPFPLMGSALARGNIAAAFIAEPALTAVKADVKILGKAYDAIAPEFLISDWFTTRTWLERNGDAAKRLTGVIYETARWANAHQDQSAPILAKYSKLDLDRVRAMTRALYATALDPRMVQPVLDAATKFKSLDRPFKAAELIVRV